MGFIVVRPLPNAPISHAVISSELYTDEHKKISVKSEYRVHLYGAVLSVTGFPVTEQDRRLGACAQSAIWMAGRHFHSKHGAPWLSVGAITEMALGDERSHVSSSLPAGADSIDTVGIVRCLSRMGRQPVAIGKRLMQLQNIDEESAVKPPPKIGWPKEAQPEELVLEYVDSGIPVFIIAGSEDSSEVQHILTVCGINWKYNSEEHRVKRVLSFVVHDDQTGCYIDYDVGLFRSPLAGNPLPSANVLIIPHPDKVFINSKEAKSISRQLLMQMCKEISENSKIKDHVGNILFNNFIESRTYLTYGHSFRRRMLDNEVSEVFKDFVNRANLPRFIWVTEFRSDIDDDVDCARHIDETRRVAAISVVDATGSIQWPSHLCVYAKKILGISGNHFPMNSFQSARNGALEISGSGRDWYILHDSSNSFMAKKRGS